MASDTGSLIIGALFLVVGLIVLVIGIAGCVKAVLLAKTKDGITEQAASGLTWVEIIGVILEKAPGWLLATLVGVLLMSLGVAILFPGTITSIRNGLALPTPAPGKTP